MSKRYTGEELKALGMDSNQIRAIISTYAREDEEREKGAEKESTVPVPSPAKAASYKDSMKVTSLVDLQSYAQGTVVRFPDFAEGQPFVARVRRPSMLVLAKQGKIPNTLMLSANELFSRGGSGLDGDNQSMLADIYSITEIICEAALVEPTYQQIKDAGLELSDDQLMAIFNYTQNGIKALESFR